MSPGRRVDCARIGCTDAYPHNMHDRPVKPPPRKKMKIYIAGKITGLDPARAATMFAAAEHLIHNLGHEPLNPMRLVDQTEGRPYNNYLHDALRHLLRADAVYMLPNWLGSTGARIEQHMALELKMPIYLHMSEIKQEETGNGEAKINITQGPRSQDDDGGPSA